MPGPLDGWRVLELTGRAGEPGAGVAASFAAMLLADMGAQVLRIRPPGEADGAAAPDVLGRNRLGLTLDLGDPAARADLRALIAQTDALVEGLPLGAMEALGLGPDACLALQPRLVYGRASGWGQHGPLAGAPGQDINHIALSGLLQAIGRSQEAPVLPLTLLGESGSGLLLAFGIVCALLETRRSGAGQVVDAASCDAAALLGAPVWARRALGQWSQPRGENRLDGGAHFYDTYACADGRYLAVGALDAQAYAELLSRCGISDPMFEPQNDPHAWPMLRGRLGRIFLGRARDEWCALLEGTAACVSPVLEWDEAPQHPHHRARQSFATLDGAMQPAPAPRFSRSATAPLRTDQPLPDLASALRLWAR